MLHHLRPALVLVAALLVVALAGCGEGSATIRQSDAALPSAAKVTQRTGFSFSRNRMIDIAVENVARTADAQPPADYDVVLISVTEPDGSHAIGDRGTSLLHLVRRGNEVSLYRATRGTVTFRFAFLTKDHVHVDFDVETVPVWPVAPKGGVVVPLTGSIHANEDITVAEGIKSAYAAEVRRLEEQAAEAAKAAPTR